MARLEKFGQYPHVSTGLSRVTIRLGGVDYLASINIRPTTPTIVNVSTTDATWTAVATGLTGVLMWRLVEESGNDFRYAFTAAPATYMVGFGWMSENTEITNIYVQRPATDNIDMLLCYWTA